eukprot:3223222-Pleurochrysis_carterae.AAC.3
MSDHGFFITFILLIGKQKNIEIEDTNIDSSYNTILPTFLLCSRCCMRINIMNYAQESRRQHNQLRLSSAMAPPRTQKLILVLATLPGTATLLIPLRAVPSSSLILSRLGTQRSRVFLPRVGNSQGRGSAVRLALAESGKGGVRSLSPACEWRLQLRLFPPTKEGAADSEAPRAEDYEVVTATVRFALDEGYEPPQGLIRVESCLPEGALKLGEMPTRWMLSEDPDDRKDSLWIWGCVAFRATESDENAQPGRRSSCSLSPISQRLLNACG